MRFESITKEDAITIFGKRDGFDEARWRSAEQLHKDWPGNTPLHYFKKMVASPMRFKERHNHNLPDDLFEI